MAVRLWEEKEEEGESKNWIRCRCHQWDEGGPHEGHERQMLHHIDGLWGGDEALGKGGVQKVIVVRWGSKYDDHDSNREFNVVRDGIH